MKKHGELASPKHQRCSLVFSECFICALGASLLMPYPETDKTMGTKQSHSNQRDWRNAKSSLTAQIYDRLSDEGAATARLAAATVWTIENDLHQRGWPTNITIASEAELAHSFSISRDVVREAVRIGEGHGSLRMRRGRHGGLISQRPELISVSRTVSEYMYCAGATRAEYLEFCDVFAPLATASAAENMPYRPAHMRKDSFFPDVPFTNEFMAGVLTYISDPVLALMWSIIGGLDVWFKTQSMAKTDREEQLRRSVEQKIIKAIEAGDPAAAKSLTRMLIGEHWRRRTSISAAILSNGDSLASNDLPAFTSSALSAHVARKLCDRIRSAASGERLGSEWDLSVEYEVNRPVLRQALRLLEDHGLLELRRGRSGGVFAAKQKPGAMLRHTYPFLASSDVHANSLAKLFWRINLAHVRLAASRAKNLDVSERRRVQREFEKELADGSDCVNWFGTQQFIAKLGESVIFDTIARILVGYSLRSLSPNGIADLSSKQLMKKSIDVVKAILQGDAEDALALQMECHKMLEAQHVCRQLRRPERPASNRD